MADEDDNWEVLTQAAQGQIRSTVERIERLEQEKTEISEQIKEVFAEAQGNGFDVKVLRKVVRIRKQDRAKRLEEEAILDLYLSAVGELPLFERPQPEPSGAPESGIATITLTMADGSAVSGTPDQLAAAERMVRGVPEEQALYDQAVALVRRDGKASASYVQRRLQLGFNRASALVERMEREGVIGPPNHAGKREVLAAVAA